MKEIPLTRGYVALVDDGDYEAASVFSWFAHTSKGRVYAARQLPRKGGRQNVIFLHNQLINSNKKMEVDHKNGNGVDCRRDNLRICSHSENMKNVGPYKNNTSGYKGVSWDKTTSKWRAKLQCNKKTYYIGLFRKSEDAALAYDKKAVEMFGEFARTNFPIAPELRGKVAA